MVIDEQRLPSVLWLVIARRPPIVPEGGGRFMRVNWSWVPRAALVWWPGRRHSPCATRGAERIRAPLPSRSAQRHWPASHL